MGKQRLYRRFRDLEIENGAHPASPQRFYPRSEHFFEFASIACTANGLVSTKVAEAAPRDSASKPKAPEPA